MLEPIVGANSLILLDERPHLSQRKLMLPAFHGERMAALTGLLEDVTERAVASWPLDEPVSPASAFPAPHAGGHSARGIRARPGRAAGPAARPAHAQPRAGRAPRVDASVPPARQIWTEFLARRDESDGLLFELIDERRAEPEGDARRRAGDAAGGAPRRRLADVEAGAARRADDAARGRARDDRLRAGLGLRAAVAHARGAAPADRRDRLGERRLLPDRDHPGDAAPPAGDPERRAAPDQAAGRDRRLQLPGGRCA